MATLLAVTSYTNTKILAHTPKGKENADGVTVYWLDHETGALTKAGAAAAPENPAFVLQHPADPEVVYASTERIDEDGAVLALRLTKKGAKVEIDVVDEAPAGGKSTCYLAADASGRWLRVANYWDAKVSVLACDGARLGERPEAHILPPAALLRSKGFSRRCEQPAEYCEQNPTREEHWRYRQRWPHAHCIVSEPYAGAAHFVVDLGEDAVYHYAFDAAVGRLACRGATTLERGAGPRHVVFHPTRPAAFLVNELVSTVSCFAFDASKVDGVRDEHDADACLRAVQKLSTLPADFNNDHRVVNGIWKARSHAAEIRLDATGDWLFVANRGHDSLAVFKVSFEGDQPSLELKHVQPTLGSCPRNYAVLDTHVVVGNQDSNELVVFARDPATGALAKVASHPHDAPNYLAPLATPAEDDHQATVRASTPPMPKASLAGAFRPPSPPPLEDAPSRLPLVGGVLAVSALVAALASL